MASIDIRTTQNVVIEYDLASLRDRFFAFFLDLVLYYLLYALLMFFVLTIFGSIMTHWGERFLWLLNLVGLLAYHFLSELFSDGQTLGKKALKIKVVRLDGRAPGLGDYLIRSAFLMVDFFLSLGILGAVLIGTTFKGQRLGDLAANTAVIRVKNQLHFRLEDILKISTLENYEPKYPAVRQLGEGDMLLLKNLIARAQTWRNTAHIDAIHEAVDRICAQLQIEAPKTNRIEFLKTLIRDYIVLTR
ncbi:MAG: RDD family protein [Lewinellaceae bacterium]|nr:RDD family protein [Saprospiraceae bacterium]MCB9338978.1 RDD family protein [Lewinellaceae bacterium]